jgi:hypothetical protein
MIKIFQKFWLGAIIIAFSLSSCSDDDATNAQPVADDVIEKGVNAYAESCIVTIPVQATDTWTASVNEDCDWLSVVNEKHTGAGSLELILDDNIGGDMRTATVTITSAGGTANVKVSQYGDVEGIVADNSNADYIQTAATKKLGVGCNLIEFYDDPTVGLEYKRNSAFNMRL